VAFTPGVDNIVVALEHSNRVWEINLWVSNCKKILVAMQEQRTAALVIPDSVLGGSALDAGLPRLLLSATHLVYLRLSL